MPAGRQACHAATHAQYANAHALNFEFLAPRQCNPMTDGMQIDSVMSQVGVFIGLHPSSGEASWEDGASERG